LKQLIVDAWVAESHYRIVEQCATCASCLELVTPTGPGGGKVDVCKTCNRAIHGGRCANGGRWAYALKTDEMQTGEMLCHICWINQGDNPPYKPTGEAEPVAAGPCWIDNQLSKYVMIMNFVNHMLINVPGAANDFMAIPNGLRLTEEVCQALVAVEMHDTNWMLGSIGFIEGLNSWLPIYHRLSCFAYLTCFYKISTTAELETICDKVLRENCSTHGIKKVKSMLRLVKAHQADDATCAVTLTGFLKEDAAATLNSLKL
jgi:hypothetical protein